jgi:putative ABC transport system permease protein
VYGSSVLFVYAYRSLLARFRANMISVLTVCLFVMGASLGLSYYTSLKQVVTSVPAENIIVVSKGATAENDSELKLETARKLVVLDGIKKQNATPLAAHELVIRVAVTDMRTSEFDTASILRGIDEQSPAVHRIQLLSGTAPQPHSLDIIVGKRLTRRYPHLRIGYVLRLPGGPSKLTGVFAADGGPFEDELWTDREAFELHTKVGASSVTLVADSAAHVPDLVARINASKDLDAQAYPVAEFGTAISGLRTIVRIVLVLLVLLSIIATFAIATTMNAAVAVRLPELAALAAIGVRKRSLARVVLVEGTLLGFVGAALGVLASGLAIGQLGFIRLSRDPIEIASSPVVLLIGLALGVLVGVLGGIAPAIQVKRLDILATLR